MNQKLIKNIAIILVLITQSGLFPMQEQEIFGERRISAPSSPLFSSIQDRQAFDE